MITPPVEVSLDLFPMQITGGGPLKNTSSLEL